MAQVDLGMQVQVMPNFRISHSAAAETMLASDSSAPDRFGQWSTIESESFQNELRFAAHAGSSPSSLCVSSEPSCCVEGQSGAMPLAALDTGQCTSPPGAPEMTESDPAPLSLQPFQMLAPAAACCFSQGDISTARIENTLSEAAVFGMRRGVSELLNQLEQTKDVAAVLTEPAANQNGLLGIHRRILVSLPELAQSLGCAPNRNSTALNQPGHESGETEKCRGADDRNAWDGKTHQPPKESPNYLAGVDLEKIAGEKNGGRLQALPNAVETGASANEGESVEIATDGGLQHAAETTAPGVIHRLGTPLASARKHPWPLGLTLRGETQNQADVTSSGSLRAMHPHSSAATEGRGGLSMRSFVFGQCAPPEDTADTVSGTESLHRHNQAAGTVQLGDSRETPQGEQNLHIARPKTAVTDVSPAAGDVRESQKEDGSVNFQRATDQGSNGGPGGEDVSRGSRVSSGDPLEMTSSDQRLPRSLDNPPIRSATAAIYRETESADETVRAGLFDQLIKRAIVQIRKDQSEIQIDLKPEFLGNVRMQIHNEHQQVSVRILADLPAVRDMLETGLQQLKLELQNQGLNVERLEVSVSADLHKQSRRRPTPEGASKTGGIHGISSDGWLFDDERSDHIRHRPWPSSAATIDMFA